MSDGEQCAFSLAYAGAAHERRVCIRWRVARDGERTERTCARRAMFSCSGVS